MITEEMIEKVSKQLTGLGASRCCSTTGGSISLVEKSEWKDGRCECLEFAQKALRAALPLILVAAAKKCDDLEGRTLQRGVVASGGTFGYSNSYSLTTPKDCGDMLRQAAKEV